MHWPIRKPPHTVINETGISLEPKWQRMVLVKVCEVGAGAGAGVVRHHLEARLCASVKVMVKVKGEGESEGWMCR